MSVKETCLDKKKSISDTHMGLVLKQPAPCLYVYIAR